MAIRRSVFWLMAGLMAVALPGWAQVEVREISARPGASVRYVYAEIQRRLGEGAHGARRVAAA